MLISNFLIKGNSTEGERIEINYEKSTNIKLNYSWQINNGFQWIVVSRLNFYDIKKNDIDKKLKCVITYFDKDKYLESISTKIWIIKEKLNLERIDCKDEKILLTFNNNVMTNKKLKLFLSNGMIAEYVTNVKSNIIEFKIFNFKKINGNIYINSINEDIKDDNNNSLDDRFKNIPIDSSLPVLKIIKDINSINSMDSVNFIFSSSKDGKIIYKGISNIVFSLENADSKKQNVISLKNINDGKYILYIKVVDIVGNESNILKFNPFTIWTKEPKLNKVSLYSSNNDNKLAKNNDIIKINIVPDNFVKILGVQIMKKYKDFSILNDGSYVAEYKVQKDDKDKIKFNIRFKSITGKINTCHITTDDSYILIDNEPPKLVNLDFRSKSKSTILKIEDYVYLEMEFNKNVDPSVLIFNQDTELERISNKKFIASLKINDSINKNFTNIVVIEFYSFSGVKGETYISNNNPFELLINKPILSEIKSIGITNNSSPIYIFNSNEDGKLYLSDKLNTDAVFVRKGNNCIKFNNLDNGIYNESLSVENKNGNRSKLNITEFKITKSSSVLELLNLSIKSDNKNSKVARIGNVVTIMFTTNKKLKNIDIEFEINGKNINFIKKIENIFNECFWSIEFNIIPNIPYGDILFNLNLEDYDGCIISSQLDQNEKVTIINPNYETLKSDFDLLNNKIDNINSYIKDIKLDQFDNIINVIEHNIFSNDIFYIWQEKNKDKWIDIKASYESTYESNNTDLGKILRVKIYFIDESKNLNFKYSEEFIITENNNVINI